MQRRGVFIAMVAAVVSLVSVRLAPAAAFDFQYGSLVTPSPINPTSTVGGPGSQVSQAGIGNFATPTAPTFNADHMFGTDITVGNITVTDLAIGANYTDNYGPTPIMIELKIKDVTSGDTGTFTFTGSLTGQVASNGTTESAVFNNPFAVPQSHSLLIGGSLYTVTANPAMDFVSPGAPPSGGSGIPGSYSFNVFAVVPPAPAPAAVWAGAVLIGGLAARKLIRLRPTT